MASAPPSGFHRLLAACPTAIAVLWLAGVARFRDLGLEPIEWLLVIAAAVVLRLLSRRAFRPRPLPPLPPGARPLSLAAAAAALVALVAGALGGLLEFAADLRDAATAPWAVRTLWHSACAFGASYCSFLFRIEVALAGSRPPPDGG